METLKRCFWCNTNNPLYVKYHDEEWGVLNLDERYLFEMLVLESFQAGLSWECVLNKRASFKKAFDNFDVIKVADYDHDKILSLKNDAGIIRNSLKIKAAIYNAKAFIKVQSEFGSFAAYLRTFVPEIIYENDRVESSISSMISNDLNKRGFRFVGSKIIYAYLQAIGLINSHDDDCYKKIRR